MKGWCAKITEGKTRLELLNNKSSEDEGFILDDHNDQIPFV
jgi:hypothetical protein